MKRLLNEVYRPSTIDGYVFQNEEVKRKVTKWVSEKTIPNILLSGISGSGKSTLAKILINELEIDPIDVKFVNCAAVKAMEFCREELTPWLKKAPMGHMKIVYLEEMNRFGLDAQKALNDLTESYSNHVRFIATTNYVNILTPELIGRFQQIHIDAMDEEPLLDFIVDIIEKEGIEVKDEDDLLSHIRAYTPNLRKIINSIDEHTDVDKVLYPLTSAAKGVDLDRWETLWSTGTLKENFDEIMEVTELIDGSNYEWFYEVMYTHHQAFPDAISAILAMSTYLDRATRASNQKLHLQAFLYTVMEDAD